MSVKFAHIADAHLGYEQYHWSWRVDDFKRVFEEAIQKAVKEKVDFILIAGDLFQKSNPAPQIIKDVIEVLTIPKKEGIPIFAIEGNHDKTIRDVSIYDVLESLGLIYTVGLKKARVESKYQESIKISSNWYLVKGIFRDIEIFGIKYMTRAYLEKFLPYLGGNGNSILMLHQSIKEIADVSNIQGYELSLSELPKNHLYYALGHIHRFCMREVDGAPLVYPGSLERYDSKEYSKRVVYDSELAIGEGQRKGFIIANDFKPKFVGVGARDLIDIIIKADNFEEAMKKIECATRHVNSQSIVKMKVISRATINYSLVEEKLRSKGIKNICSVTFEIPDREGGMPEIKNVYDFLEDDFEIKLFNELKEKEMSDANLRNIVNFIKTRFDMHDIKPLKEEEPVEAGKIKMKGTLNLLQFLKKNVPNKET